MKTKLIYKHWSNWLIVVIISLHFTLRLGITAGTSFHPFAVCMLLLLFIALCFYWLVKGIRTKQKHMYLGGIFTPIIIGVFYFGINYDRIQLDGKRAEVFSFFAGENSNYPFGFTHRAFRKIKIGMTKIELLGLVGNPLQIWPYSKNSDTLGYKYCLDGRDTHHRVRIVLLRTDTVVKIHNSFYYD